MAWSRTPGDGRSGRKQRRSSAVCEGVEDENVVNGASRLDVLARGEPGRRGASSECVGAARGGLEQRRIGEVKAVVFSFVFSLSNLQRKSRKRGKRLAAA
jgi:hypothetical protein